MKKGKTLFISICSAAFLLAGCTSTIASSIDDIVSSSITSLSSEENNEWNEEQKALMIKYCGEVLPYPTGLVSGSFLFKEQESNGEMCLLILNESETFSIKTYYEFLEESGWNTITGYKKNKVQGRNGTTYVELTKNSEDSKTGYEIMYYHLEDVSIDSTSSPSSYNCISCFNNYSSSAREETNWNSQDNQVIEYVTTTTLPYLALGDNYYLYASSANELDIYDYYTKDLTDEYVSILKKDGYVLNQYKSNQQGINYLSKEFEDGSNIEICLYYFKGNNIYVYYTPKINQFTSWPTEIVTPVEEKTGVSIPAFPIKDGGTYYEYAKHGVTYLITYDMDSSFDYNGYINNVRSYLFSWEENLSLSAYILTDEDYNEIGFMVYFEPTSPSSIFTSSWPKDGIKEGLKNSLGIEGVDIPELDVSSFNLEKEMKYSSISQSDYEYYYEYYLSLFETNYGGTYSEETIIEMAKEYVDSLISKGVTLSVYDSMCDTQKDYIVRYKVNEAYKELLYKSCWYRMSDDKTVYEDPTGKVAIKVLNTPYSSNGYTSIAFTEGSGIAHSPVIEFSKDTYEIGAGNKLSLNLNTNMLPFDITYSSSDTSGKVSVNSDGVVSVSEDATIGDEVTISASCIDNDGVAHSASCVIKIVKGLNYKSVLEEVETLLKGKGYDTYTKEDIYAIGSSTKVVGEKLTINFGTSLTKSEVKSMAKNDLLPENFISSIWSNASYEDDSISNEAVGNSPISKMAKKTSTPSDLEYMYCFYTTDYARLTLYYYVYTADNGDIIMYVESRSISR